MANWGNINDRGSVEDRRGFGPSAVGGGLGLTGLAIYVAFSLLSGADPARVAQEVLSTQIQPASNAINAQNFQGEDSYEVFASTVLGSTNATWTQVLGEQNRTYQDPKLVLFRGSTQSACGGATSDIGPHYCPNDGTIYLDETFFDELKNKLGGDNGDVAQAYVIAHEVGHNVQHQLGIDEGVDDNASSVKLELQADCYAGIWMHSIQDRNVFEPGEIQEALSAAAAVGDDRIQKASTGRVNPEKWTHGSAEERTSWLTKGYDTGSMAACDTFAT